jgi:isopentenyl-diphosphate delta-isomerase
MRDKVVLVNEADESLGEMEKIEAHKKNKLHRAFSVFVFSKSEL